MDERGILKYETALDRGARRRLDEIGSADILIGIPSHRNARTIEEVLQAVGDGVDLYLRDQRVVLMNADGGSSDNTAGFVADARMPANVRRLLVAYEGPTGKGTGVRAVLEAAAALETKACIVLEARAPGILPEWIPALASPVLEGYELVLPCFQRSAYSAALVDNLLYPFMHMFLRTDLRQPLTSEFCISGKMAGELAATDVWETAIARFGVSIWVAIQALSQGRRVCQVELGVRGETSGDPGAPIDARFLHNVGTLFRLLTVQKQAWEEETILRPVPYHGARCPDRIVPCIDCDVEMARAMPRGRAKYEWQWKQILHPETLKEVMVLMDAPPEEMTFSVDFWSRVAIEFAVVYNQGEGDPDKVVEALQPLFYGRASSYIRESRGLSHQQREILVADILRAFEENRQRFEEMWQSYEQEEQGDAYWFV